MLLPDYDYQALVAWAGYGCYFSAIPAFQWRFELSAQAVAPLLLHLATPWLPEYPLWHAEKGRDEEALAALENLRFEGTGLSAREEFFQMYQQISLVKEASKQTGRFPLFTIPFYRRRLLFSCLTQFSVSLQKVLVVNNYQ
ncbi:hypothetical protein BDV29DRAFT_158617 [Aspergillus leporis]|jgi:hypothetical protein|uniref:Uncharacterized protein n=1 Tax=Aspergillus leporis TaxID=41062 RepID=A0A5N5WXB0_9EURO|nr:hypothetical protein BDV29DRAFT_158617 [Aspergillus leporis]